MKIDEDPWRQSPRSPRLSSSRTCDGTWTPSGYEMRWRRPEPQRCGDDASPAEQVVWLVIGGWRCFGSGRFTIWWVG